MKYYAEVINNFVHFANHIFPEDFIPEYDPEVLMMVDITYIDPKPEQGDYFDAAALNFIYTDNHPAIIDMMTLSAENLDMATISQLPSLSVITILNERFEVTDGILEFTIDEPGVYDVIINSFPYKKKVFKVTVI